MQSSSLFNIRNENSRASSIDFSASLKYERYLEGVARTRLSFKLDAAIMEANGEIGGRQVDGG